MSVATPRKIDSQKLPTAATDALKECKKESMKKAPTGGITIPGFLRVKAGKPGGQQQLKPQRRKSPKQGRKGIQRLEAPTFKKKASPRSFSKKAGPPRPRGLKHGASAQAENPTNNKRRSPRRGYTNYTNNPYYNPVPRELRRTNRAHHNPAPFHFTKRAVRHHHHHHHHHHRPRRTPIPKMAAHHPPAQQPQQVQQQPVPAPRPPSHSQPQSPTEAARLTLETADPRLGPAPAAAQAAAAQAPAGYPPPDTQITAFVPGHVPPPVGTVTGGINPSTVVAQQGRWIAYLDVQVQALRNIIQLQASEYEAKVFALHTDLAGARASGAQGQASGAQGKDESREMKKLKAQLVEMSLENQDLRGRLTLNTDIRNGLHQQSKSRSDTSENGSIYRENFNAPSEASHTTRDSCWTQNEDGSRVQGGRSYSQWGGETASLFKYDALRLRPKGKQQQKPPSVQAPSVRSSLQGIRSDPDHHSSGPAAVGHTESESEEEEDFENPGLWASTLADFDKGSRTADSGAARNSFLSEPGSSGMRDCISLYAATVKSDDEDDALSLSEAVAEGYAQSLAESDAAASFVSCATRSVLKRSDLKPQEPICPPGVSGGTRTLNPNAPAFLSPRSAYGSCVSPHMWISPRQQQQQFRFATKQSSSDRRALSPFALIEPNSIHVAGPFLQKASPSFGHQTSQNMPVPLAPNLGQVSATPTQRSPSRPTHNSSRNTGQPEKGKGRSSNKARGRRRSLKRQHQKQQARKISPEDERRSQFVAADVQNRLAHAGFLGNNDCSVLGQSTDEVPEPGRIRKGRSIR